MNGISPHLTPKAQQEIERLWTLRRNAVELLGLVVAEWKSDPQSVACFDLRTVERAKAVIAEIEPLMKKYYVY